MFKGVDGRARDMKRTCDDCGHGNVAIVAKPCWECMDSSLTNGDIYSEWCPDNCLGIREEEAI